MLVFCACRWSFWEINIVVGYASMKEYGEDQSTIGLHVKKKWTMLMD